MATATMTIFTMTSHSLKLPQHSDYVEFQSLHHCVRVYHRASLTKFGNKAIINRCHRESSTHSSCKWYLRHLAKPVSAVRSGLEASITDPEENAVHFKNAKIVVESQDDAKLQVRVDLAGEETKIVFEKVLSNLARTAPPVPGFRRQKGGKASKVNIPMTSLYPMKKFLACNLLSSVLLLDGEVTNRRTSFWMVKLQTAGPPSFKSVAVGECGDCRNVPKDFLLQMLGEERVTNFVIQEIVSSTLADYTKKENLTVKDNKINTIQTAEELRSSFVPGKEFGFSATLELEILPTETSMQ